MCVFDIVRAGVWVRQIMAWNQREADLWCRLHCPKCRARLAYRLSSFREVASV